MEKPNLLLVDDNPGILKVYSLLLSENFNVVVSKTVKEAKALLTNMQINVMVLDMQIDLTVKDGGLRVIEHLKQLKLNTKTIVLTAHAEVDNVIKAFKGGVFDYIRKGKESTHDMVLSSTLKANQIYIEENMNNGKPRIFIGSSVEGLDVAYAIQENLEFHDAEITVWSQDFFDLSKSTLDNLLEKLKEYDYAVFVFTPDDITKMRDINYSVIRDNVLFEMGLFMGYLGKDRVFYIVPNNTINFHLPSDLVGIIGGKYNPNRTDNNLPAATSPFCNKIRKIIRS